VIETLYGKTFGIQDSVIGTGWQTAVRFHGNSECFEERHRIVTYAHHYLPDASNASAHLLPEAGATEERTLEAVRCSALFGLGSFWLAISTPTLLRADLALP